MCLIAFLTIGPLLDSKSHCKSVTRVVTSQHVTDAICLLSQFAAFGDMTWLIGAAVNGYLALGLKLLHGREGEILNGKPFGELLGSVSMFRLPCCRILSR